MPPTLEVTGFTSTPNAHAHLLKHVVRVTEVRDLGPGAEHDAEGWRDVMDEPPLVANLERRRTSALAVLRNATGCAAGQIGVTSEKPCATCQDRRAMRVVSDGMNILMTRYVQAAQAALDGAFANPDRHGPRLVAYEVEGRGTVETIDSKHVSVVGRLDQGTAVALVTCYRDRSRSLQSWWLEHARLRAAHRRAGTLLTLG